jgi:predicted phage terminase large subunit-like protein
MSGSRLLQKAMASNLTQEEFRALLRMDLGAFAERCFQELNPNTPYEANWHQDLIASKLEACRRGEIRRLIINIPPRHLKSLFASVAFPAFWLGHDPSAQIICVSYAQNLSNKLSMDCRSIMMQPWFLRLFPKSRLSKARAAVEEFTTTARGCRMATSVGGVLTGRGADLIILDDPLKPDEATSETQRTKVNTWYDETLYSRLNAKKTGVIIIVMQRLHLDDLVGHVLEKGGWEVVSLPSIAEEDERHLIQGLEGAWEQVRRPGEVLHAKREDLETLRQLEASLGEYVFAAQFQQSPVPRGGGMIKAKWWGIYDEPPATFDRTIQSWDTASKTNELNDFSVCTTWGKKGGELYLLDVLRQRMNFPDLKRAVIEHAKRHRPDIILIEDKVSGTALIQQLKHEGVRGVLGVQSEDNKVMRLNTHLPWIEGGHVHLPRAAPWLQDYRQELERFPVGKYDDQVDSTSQALAWAQKNQWHGRGLILGGNRRISAELDRYVGADPGPPLYWAR